jgi:hypothetical protein
VTAPVERYPAGAAPRDPASVGIGRGQLNHWIAQGLVHPANNDRRGRILLWTDVEWRVVRHAAGLAALGFRPALAVTIAREAQHGVRVELALGLTVVVAPSFNPRRTPSPARASQT